MSNLINKDGTRKIHVLLGDHDEDYFLTKDDMSEGHWNLLMSCYHQGQCDEDCIEATKYFDFPSDEAWENALEYLLDCGIERDRFYSLDEDDEECLDSDAVMQYYLWILSGDIQERSDNE